MPKEIKEKIIKVKTQKGMTDEETNMALIFDGDRIMKQCGIKEMRFEIGEKGGSLGYKILILKPENYKQLR